MEATGIRRLGILTGGGDCPGLNAVIRAVSKTAFYRYNVEVMGIMNGFGGLINNEAMLLTEKHVSGILHRGGTILGTTNRDNPFHYPAGSKDGRTVYADVSQRVIHNLKKMGIDVLIVVGGDGSLSIAYRLHELGVPVVGIPKTIDNDLAATDITFGFETAVNTATDAIDKLHTTAESHHRIMFLEVMGRNAGWIALHAGMAGGADVILIPEIPFTYEGIFKKIEQRQKLGKRFSLVVVAEGARLPSGSLVYQSRVADNPLQDRLGGVSEVIARKIMEMTGVETRVTVLGHIQRGGAPAPYDRNLSTRFGTYAVKIAVEKRFGHMVCLCNGEIGSVPLADAVSRQKLVDPDGELVEAARAVGISFGD